MKKPKVPKIPYLKRKTGNFDPNLHQTVLEIVEELSEPNESAANIIEDEEESEPQRILPNRKRARHADPAHEEEKAQGNIITVKVKLGP